MKLDVRCMNCHIEVYYIRFSIIIFIVSKTMECAVETVKYKVGTMKWEM